MGVSDDLMGLAVPIVEVGALTSMTKNLFGENKTEKKRVRKATAKRKKAHSKRVQRISKDVKKYL